MSVEQAVKRGRKKNRTEYIDYTLLVIIIILMAFGFVMLYSTSAYMATLKYGNSIYYLKKQMMAAGLGAVLGVIFLKVFDYHILDKLSMLIFGAANVACLAVNFIGTSSHGQSRWIYIGPISFQPSELAKMATIFMIASVVAKKTKALRDFKNAIKVLCMCLPLTAIIAYNNLSTAIIVIGIAGIMVFVASPEFKRFFLILMGGVAFAGIFVLLASGSYRMQRIQVWLHPENFTSDSSYQTLQGLYAIGSGGLFGKGLGESMQKLGFVPEAQNDMIFSIICEELGLFGAICVILMYILLLWRLVLIATKAKDIFGSFVVIGIMAHMALQVILNIAVVTNTIPNTGITLPFISYGGTSIMFLVFEMFVALSVSKGLKLEEV